MLKVRTLILADLFNVDLARFGIFTHLAFTSSSCTVNTKLFLIPLLAALVCVVLRNKVLLWPDRALIRLDDLTLI